MVVGLGSDEERDSCTKLHANMLHTLYSKQCPYRPPIDREDEIIILRRDGLQQCRKDGRDDKSGSSEWPNNSHKPHRYSSSND